MVGRLKKQTLGAEERKVLGREEEQRRQRCPRHFLTLPPVPGAPRNKGTGWARPGSAPGVRRELVGSFTLSLIPTSCSLSLGYTFPSEKPALLGDLSHQHPTQHLLFHLFRGSPP